MTGGNKIHPSVDNQKKFKWTLNTSPPMKNDKDLKKGPEKGPGKKVL